MSKNTESWTRHFLPRHLQSARSHSDHYMHTFSSGARVSVAHLLVPGIT